jgi:hypothetical protein
MYPPVLYGFLIQNWLLAIFMTVKSTWQVISPSTVWIGDTEQNLSYVHDSEVKVTSRIPWYCMDWWYWTDCKLCSWQWSQSDKPYSPSTVWIGDTELTVSYVHDSEAKVTSHILQYCMDWWYWTDCTLYSWQWSLSDKPYSPGTVWIGDTELTVSYIHDSEVKVTSCIPQY